MKWYKNKEELDYSEPIIACGNGVEFLLLPNQDTHGNVRGFDWFNIKEGRFNSNCCWVNPAEAVSEYKNRYEIMNAAINIDVE